MARIEFKAVCKRFGPRLPLTINQLSLTIEEGEFCVFVGPSGCGKSTLLRMVAGLESVSAGEIRIAGQRVNDLPPARRGVAMVFQSYALYPHMTVAQNMAFGLRVLGADKADIERRIRHAADILQLTPLMDRLPRQLSGGQRQRVAIGRAIVRQPRVFLFDEPLSNLDAALRVQTRLEIARLHQGNAGASMVYVTHDQVEAMTLADKIVLLRSGPAVELEGSVAQCGSPMDLYHRPQNLFTAAFIGSPKMNLLPGRLLQAEAGHALVEVQGEPVRVAVDARAAKAGDPVTLGVRPEHLVVRDGDSDAGASLKGRLQQVERLGDSSLLYLSVDPAAPLVTLKLDGAAEQAPGAPISLQLRPEACHLFDGAGQAFERTVALPR
jgi:multiple sugar transport system ATP-binding protein